MEKGRITKLIIPLILEQLLTVSVGFIDTFMVSQVGEAAVSGVALVDSINLLVIQVMAAFAAGGIVVISQYLGDHNRELSSQSCKQLELLMNSFAILVTVIFLLAGKSILRGLFGGIAEDVMEASVTYLLITAVSFVFWGLYTAGAAIFRCYEDTKTAMQVSLVMNVMNVALNALLVFVMKWGVMGVAVATLISRATAGVAMKILLELRRRRMGEHGMKFKPVPVLLKKILAMGIPSGIENGMFHMGKLVLTSVIATLGTTAIAANSISYQIVEFPNIPGVTIGMAMVVIIGQDIGASDPKRATSDLRHMLKLAYLCDWICKILLFILAPYIVGMFSLSIEATATAVQVLRVFSVVSLFLWPLSYTLPNALRGAGDVTYTMIASIISMWIGRVIVSFILIRYFNLGILGVWIGMFVDWFGRGLLYIIRILSGKWLTKKVV